MMNDFSQIKSLQELEWLERWRVDRMQIEIPEYVNKLEKPEEHDPSEGQFDS